jgi:hypothetical protein
MARSSARERRAAESAADATISSLRHFHAFTLFFAFFRFFFDFSDDCFFHFLSDTPRRFTPRHAIAAIIDAIIRHDPPFSPDCRRYVCRSAARRFPWLAAISLASIFSLIFAIMILILLR